MYPYGLIVNLFFAKAKNLKSNKNALHFYRHYTFYIIHSTLKSSAAFYFVSFAIKSCMVSAFLITFTLDPLTITSAPLVRELYWLAIALP